MYVKVSQQIDKGSWYNTTIFKKLNGQIFEDYFKTLCKDRYELMCAINDYDKYNVPIPDDTSTGSGRSMKGMSSKEALFSLGQTINFIENWLQCFEVSY